MGVRQATCRETMGGVLWFLQTELLCIESVRLRGSEIDCMQKGKDSRQIFHIQSTPAPPPPCCALCTVLSMPGCA